MKSTLIRLWKSGKAILHGENIVGLDRSCTGRILGSLTFIVVILCLASWITAFLVIKDRLYTETLSGNILTNLTCITFFGGLVISFIVGALLGNLLRRAFWRWLTRRKKL